MYFYTFSRSKAEDGKNFVGKFYYAGTTKDGATHYFNEQQESLFSITAKPVTLYLVCFDEENPYIESINYFLDKSKDYSSDTKAMNILLRILDSALYTYILDVSGRKSVSNVISTCFKCQAERRTLTKNIYNEYLCPDCYAEYLLTTKGLAEFYVQLAREEIGRAAFSDDDFAKIREAWNTPVDPIDPDYRYKHEYRDASGVSDDYITKLEAAFSKL